MHTRYEQLVTDELINKLNKYENLGCWIDEETGAIPEKDEPAVVAALLKVFGEKSIFVLATTIGFLSILPAELLMKVAGNCGITIHDKQRKRGKEFIIMKLIDSRHKPDVRSTLAVGTIKSCGEAYGSIIDSALTPAKKIVALKGLSYGEDPLFGHWRKLSPDGYEFVAGYFLGVFFNDNRLATYCLKKFGDKQWHIYQKLIIETAGFVYNIYASKQPQVDIRTVSKEKRKLQKKYESALKQQEKLENNLKELDKNAEEQLKDALSEIDFLNGVIEDKDDIIAELNLNIHLLKEELGRELDKRRYLEGLTVCVIGLPLKKQRYQEVIEKYGGTFEFASSIDSEEGPARMKGPVRRSDIIIYVTSVANHTTYNYLQSIVDFGRVEVIDTPGIGSFEYKLVTEIIPKRVAVRTI